jgi:hypothetical protein
MTIYADSLKGQADGLHIVISSKPSEYVISTLIPGLGQEMRIIYRALPDHYLQ